MRLKANSVVKIKGAPDVKPGALFEVEDEALARRLVAVGYAVEAGGVRVQEAGSAPPASPVSLPPVSSPPPSSDLPAPDASMSLAELKALAARYGVNADKKKTKAEVIATIEAAGRAAQ